MGNSVNKHISSLNFYYTTPHSCSYLNDVEATTLFLDPKTPASIEVYEQLTKLNFRRSGKHLYRPHCSNCQACKACRIPVNQFQISRRFRRILNKNQDLELKVYTAEYREEDFSLFERYIKARHADGDMFPPSINTYRDFLTNDSDYSYHLRYFFHDQLIAVAVTDILLSGQSAIYTFFDPDFSHRSLGNFSILMQISLAQKLKLPYVYLGYWIENCDKMNYKTQFQPLDIFNDGQWIRYSP